MDHAKMEPLDMLVFLFTWDTNVPQGTARIVLKLKHVKNQDKHLQYFQYVWYATNNYTDMFY